MEERVYVVEGLFVPEADVADLEELPDEAAVRLFEHRARGANFRFKLTSELLPEVLRLCRLVEGFPLGIELAAVWVRLLNPREIADEIERNLDFLATPARNVAARQRSVRAAFEHSWRLLNPREQQGLRRLSVFRGGFRREAASEVSGATIPVLASLVDTSFLRVLPNGRYDQHPLLYQYSCEKLAELPEEECRVQDQHGEYFFRFLERRPEATILGPRAGEALTAIGDELENIRVAWQWAVARGRDSALRSACLPLRNFFVMRARFHEGIEVFDQVLTGLAATEADHHLVLGTVMIEQCWLFHRLGHNEEAIARIQQGLELVAPSKDLEVMRRGLDALGVINTRLGFYREAKHYTEEALGVAVELGEPSGSLMNNLAMVEEALGNYPAARRHYQEALARHWQQGRRFHAVTTLNNLGRLFLAMGNPKEALVVLQEGLALAREVDFRQLIPELLSSLGRVAYQGGDYTEARRRCLEALNMVRKSGDRVIGAAVLTNLGRVATALASLEEAERYLLESLDLARSSRQLPNVLQNLILLAELRARQGRPDLACEWLALALRHHALARSVRDQAERAFEEVRKRLTTDELTACAERAGELELEELVRELLR